MKKSLKEVIFQRIDSHFNPQFLEIEDQSALHKGHMGIQNAQQEETHFKIKVDSQAFIGLSRIDRHRLVYDVLGPSLMSKIHALTIVILEKTSV